VPGAFGLCEDHCHTRVPPRDLIVEANPRLDVFWLNRIGALVQGTVTELQWGTGGGRLAARGFNVELDGALPGTGPEEFSINATGQLDIPLTVSAFVFPSGFIPSSGSSTLTVTVPDGLSLEPATPLPAALPLFATGLGATRSARLAQEAEGSRKFIRGGLTNPNSAAACRSTSRPSGGASPRACAAGS
jgi:hypothetical protein